MRKVLVLFIAIITATLISVPASGAAQTISASQTITITARVAPARSIIINEQGAMTKIYSNTDENVTPKVYLNDMPGEVRLLTPELLQQYEQVMSQQKKVIGVEIPVEPARATNDSVQKLLFSTVSTFLMKF